MATINYLSNVVNGETSVSVYTVFEKNQAGEPVHILDVLVDNMTYEIAIADPKGANIVLTKGVATTRIVENTPDGAVLRVSADSVKGFVLPRLARFVAQVYAPQMQVQA